MNRFKKYLATAVLLALPILAACGEDPIIPPATGSITGQVSIEGMGADGVSVNLSNGSSAVTAGGGTYRFDGVLAGAYTVTISGFPTDASFDATSASVTIPETGGSVTHNFQGSYIRTASVMGSVTVEGVGLGGVTVRLSGMADSQTATDMSGQYAFTGLRAGNYAVEISGFDTDEVAFGATSSSATVGVGESKIVSFDGTYLRTAGIVGRVTVEGDGLQGVTVSLSGVEQRTMTTDAGGQYAFSKLKAGDYSVAISDYDTDDYAFEQTSKSVTIATGETATVPFDGTLLRTSGISGRVSVEGMGLDDVEVTLAGAAEATSTTANGGQYAFAGLAEGTYVVSMMNPNETAYSFETMSATVVLGDAESNITNFDGTHTRTASVSGMAYIDEAPADKMYTANEPPLAHAGIPIVLQGPGVNDVVPGMTGEDGSYMFENLMAGSYRVLVNMTEEVAAAIAMAGFAYKGDLTGEVIGVEAGGSATVNFPFGITMQTIGVGARMGVGDELGLPVAGVKLALYANAGMTGMLGEATTDSMGVATFDFARADNTGPGGNDNLAFISVASTGHDALTVSNNGVIEVSYAGIERVAQAPAAVTLANTMANFQYWVKSDKDARGGDMGLGGWATEVTMGKDTVPLMMVDEDGDTVNAVMATDTAMASRGRAGLSYTVAVDDLPATFNVMVGEKQAGAMGEKFDQGDALMHTHTGLMHPDANTAKMNDLGPIYVTFTTQTLTVGVYREIDDEPGFTDYRAPMGGDARPVGSVGARMSAQLMTRDSRNRLRPYEYDHDGKESTDDISSMAIDKNGMASFPHLPADGKFTVRLRVGSGRMLVGETDAGDIEAFGADLDVGMSTGSFGEASGAGPEVELCSLTTSRRAKECATFAYQWETGSVSGSVAGAGGASVSLTAETDADDRSTKTSTKTATLRQFSISDIQDGEYELTTPNTADNSFSPKGGFELEIYHDETKDDDDTEYVGTVWSKDNADFTATKLRLSIKGYVANDGGDGRARGNEAQPGVDVNLLKIAKATDVSKNLKDTTFTTVATASTDASGLYEFNNLTEGGKYFVEVPAGRDYMGLRDHADGPNNKSGEVEPDEYPAFSEGENLAGKLPSWNHKTNMTSNDTSMVTDGKTPVVVSATLQNFALVYTTSNVSGNVDDVGSSTDSGIIVETAICREYTPDDSTTTGADENEEDCNWQREDVVDTRTAKGGDYDFNGLMEGYYAVWYTGGGLDAAMLNDEGKPDDDGTETSPSSRITPVMGRNQYSTGNDFHVYNTQAGTADELTSLMVLEIDAAGDTTDHADGESIPTQDDNTGTDDMSGVGETIDYASGGVSISTKQSAGASAKASIADDDFSVGNLPFNKTGSTDAGTAITTTITLTVTAANGYNDHDYTFAVERTAPEDNEPGSITAAGSNVIWADGGYHDEGVAADLAKADIVIDLEDGQSVEVTVGGDAVTGKAGTADDTIHTFTVDTAVGQTTVNVKVTSEDGVAASMTISFRRPSA